MQYYRTERTKKENMDPKKNVLTQQKKYIAAIRLSVKSQLALWQQVPYLALYATGRHNYEERGRDAAYQIAYEKGCWLICSLGDRFAIDCVTGKINKYAKQVHTDEIAKSDLHELDAEKVIHELATLAKLKMSDTFLKSRQIKLIEQWHKKMCDQHVLHPYSYVRVNTHPYSKR